MSPRRRAGGGFTLMELLVVISIVILVSAVALPAIIPALQSRQVSEGARVLQAGLVSARDAAIRANAPRGIRLLPDPALLAQMTAPPGILAYNRFIPIEPAPDLKDDSVNGSATFPQVCLLQNASLLYMNPWSWTNTGNAPPPFPFPSPLTSGLSRGTYPYQMPPPTSTGVQAVLMVEYSVFQDNMPTKGMNPTASWFWNVRIGDRFRFNDSGRYYTVVGPMTIPNPEYFVNDGTGMFGTLQETYMDGAGKTYVQNPQYLFLVNGVDDDGDGYVDNGVDGVDENLNLLADDIFEWSETEKYLGAAAKASQAALIGPTAGVQVADPANPPAKVPVQPVLKWTIARRPIPSPNAQETTLPGGAVIDATTWNYPAASPSRERSRLPIDPNTLYVDILMNQAGQVVPTTVYSNPGSVSMDSAFLHFWIADRTDVYEVMGNNPPPVTKPPYLPIPPPPSGSYANVVTTLKRERQLLTLFARTGQIVTNSIENFDFANAYGSSGTPYDANVPFDDAQMGMREAK